MLHCHLEVTGNPFWRSKWHAVISTLKKKICSVNLTNFEAKIIFKNQFWTLNKKIKWRFSLQNWDKHIWYAPSAICMLRNSLLKVFLLYSHIWYEKNVHVGKLCGSLVQNWSAGMWEEEEVNAFALIRDKSYISGIVSGPLPTTKLLPLEDD